MSALCIVSCGPATSIQDHGRPGHARIGLPSAGAMDPRALRAANALVGNAPDEAAIELAYMGMVIRIEGGPVQMALAGAPASIVCDGRPVAAHCTFEVADTSTVEIGAMSEGAYAVLAVSGGIAVPPALGSRSLDARAGIGGLHGRRLRAGDRIPLRPSHAPFASRAIAPVSLDPEAPIRIVLGPQAEAFTERGLQTLIGRSFVVSHAASRMALRLDGPPIERRAGFEMMSDGTLPGSIQVPPDGSALVLMADRQTVGGYPKIATVIGADLGRLAQRRIGTEVRFVPVSSIEAREIARQSQLAALELWLGGDIPESALMVSRQRAPGLSAALEIDPTRLSGIADAVVDAAHDASWEQTASGALQPALSDNPEPSDDEREPPAQDVA